MSVSASWSIWLRDSRLRRLALGPLPAWLWSIDAAHVIWANPTGAAIFGAATSATLVERRFDAGQPAAAQVAWLGTSLASDSAPRLERLRGFGAGLGRALNCMCSRITLADATAAILIVATEQAGPDLSLAERAQRLLAGSDEPIAIFDADGELMAATSAAPWRLDPTRALGALGVSTPAADALRKGRADGEIDGIPMALERFEAGTTAVLIATVPPVEPSVSPEPANPMPETAPIQAETVTTPSPPPPPAATEPLRPPPADLAPPSPERRHPLRFVWQMDADGRFTIGSDEFIELIGPQTAARLGQPWDDLAAGLGLDADGHVARAFNSRDTWSGLSVAWPADDSSERLAVELSGLPVFDRDRNFRGYRGFGVCRDLARLGALATLRQAATVTPNMSVEDVATADENPVSDSNTPATDANADMPEHEPSPPPTESALVENTAPAEDAVENIVQFPSAPPPDASAPALTPVERRAFRELARRLTERLSSAADEPLGANQEAADAAFPASDPTLSDLAEAAKAVFEQGPSAGGEEIEEEQFDTEPAGEGVSAMPRDSRSILDCLPMGVLVYRLEQPLYANRAFLDSIGHDDLESLIEAGGLNSLLIQPTGDRAEGPTFAVASETGDRPAFEGRLVTVQWDGEDAHALLVTTAPAASAGRVTTQARDDAADEARQQEMHENEARENELRELKSILDTVTDGVLVLDREGRICSANRSAQALFGADEQALAGGPFSDLFAPESVTAAADYLSAVLRNGVGSMLNGGREVTGRERRGGLIPLFVTMGRLGGGEKVCAVLRDITQSKKTEENLTDATQRAERASSAKYDFLATISHEIRTPLNSIIGFSEVMIQERFGAIGNERYRDYLTDIRASGTQLISLVNDLLDLSKIEAGKLELTFTGIALNDVVQQCVASVQPAASRERVIIRTSLSPKLPQVTADANSVRQIVLNLLTNSLRFTAAGGQVFVSTVVTDAGEIALRVRDTGVGMSEQEIASALEPFRQLATSTRFGSGGMGLGLPLTKAMAQANGASFHMSCKPHTGTLVEVTFAKAAVTTG